LEVVKNATEETVAYIFRKSRDEVIWCNKTGDHSHNSLTLELDAYHVTDTAIPFLRSQCPQTVRDFTLPPKFK
jgi:hypothetical protein